MIKSILSILLFLFLSNIFAQTVDYFNDNPSWNVRVGVSAGYPEPDDLGYTDKVKYYTSGTEEIGGNTYYKIKSKTYRQYDPYSEPTYPFYLESSDSYELFVRQEGNAIYYLEGEEDSLLISYDMEIGDQMSGAYGYHETYTVDSISTVMVGAEERSVFFMEESGSGIIVELIEGLGFRNMESGSEGDFFGSPGAFGQSGISFSINLICYGESDVYLWGSEENCFLTLSLDENEDLNQTKIYPNPSSSILNVSSQKYIKSLNLYGVDGKVIVQKIELHDLNYTIDISNFDPALYLVEMVYTDGSVERKTVLKN